MIDYEERHPEWKEFGLTNDALPRTKREGVVARAAFVAGQLAMEGWQRPDCDACIAYPGDECDKEGT